MVDGCDKAGVEGGSFRGRALSAAPEAKDDIGECQGADRLIERQPAHEHPIAGRGGDRRAPRIGVGQFGRVTLVNGSHALVPNTAKCSSVSSRSVERGSSRPTPESFTPP